MEAPKPRVMRNRRNNDRGTTHRQHSADPGERTAEQWPLEMAPVRRAIVEYGSRAATSALSRGAQTLLTFTGRIRELNINNPELASIVIDAELAARRMLSTHPNITDSGD